VIERELSDDVASDFLPKAKVGIKRPRNGHSTEKSSTKNGPVIRDIINTQLTYQGRQRHKISRTEPDSS
jgi:hypothetical protein